MIENLFYKTLYFGKLLWYNIIERILYIGDEMFRYNFLEILINVPITLIALTFHELAHGWVSTKLGDPTPRIHGRLTLNPMAHLDLFGTILMVLTGFGWAKPVEVNPQYYRDKKKGMALVGLAGPLANLILAILGMIIWVLPYAILQFLNVDMPQTVHVILGTFMPIFIIRNLSFMVFNLIPIPPLDGSRIIGMFLSNKAYYTLMSYERYSMIIIMLLSLTGVFSGIIGGGVSFFFNLIFNGIGTLFGVI